MFLRRSEMRVARPFQTFTMGDNTSWFAANRATAAIAMIMRSCWRFLICIPASFIPLEVERELHCRRLAPGRSKSHLAELRDLAHVLDRLLQHAALAGDAGAGDRV